MGNAAKLGCERGKWTREDEEEQPRTAATGTREGREAAAKPLRTRRDERMKEEQPSMAATGTRKGREDEEGSQGWLRQGHEGTRGRRGQPCMAATGTQEGREDEKKGSHRWLRQGHRRDESIKRAAKNGCDRDTEGTRKGHGGDAERRGKGDYKKIFIIIFGNWE